MEQPRGARLLSALMRVRRQFMKLLDAGAGDLSHGEYLVLRSVRHSALMISGKEKPLKAADLSDLLEVSRPAITRILNSLEQRGLITRNIDKTDRRSINIALTEPGARALEAANRQILGMADRVVTSLGDADADKLIELLGRLSAAFGEMLHESTSEKAPV